MTNGSREFPEGFSNENCTLKPGYPGAKPLLVKDSLVLR